jgi:hypothetical protein
MKDLLQQEQEDQEGYLSSPSLSKIVALPLRRKGSWFW